MTDKNRAMKWQQWSAQSFFFIGGFGAATWAAIVPLVKMRLQLTEDVLGMLLLCIGIGSLCTMPFSGAASAKWGCRKVLTVAGAGYGVVLILLTQVTSLWVAVPLVLILGALMGAIDVVVNVLAVIVEKNSGKRLMSGMHAFWSWGDLIGAGIFGIWLNLGLTHFHATLLAGGIIFAVMVIFCKHLLNNRSEKKQGSLLPIPRGVVIFVAVIAFISFLVEGAVMDWGGVFLIEMKNFEISMAGMGFTLFSAGTVIMRMAGDWLVNRLGAPAVTIGGAVLAAAGFVILVLSPFTWLLYMGFLLIGIGVANIVPVFFSLMGQQKDMPLNQAVSAVGTLGYSGVLMGPPLIGFVAHSTSLYISFALLAALALLQAFIAKYVYSRVL